jgi:iron-sulfur cluster assembly accessory protein
MINITEEANEHLSRIVRDQDVDGIELGVKGGGCAGFTYEWDLVKDIPKEHDIIPLYMGNLYVRPEAMMFLMNVTIDYTDGINGSYIVFKNPNATSQCGCGESFGV